MSSPSSLPPSPRNGDAPVGGAADQDVSLLSARNVPETVAAAVVLDACVSRQLSWALCTTPPEGPRLNHFAVIREEDATLGDFDCDYFYSVAFDHDEEGVISSGLHRITPKAARMAVTANVTTGSKRDLAKMLGGDGDSSDEEDEDDDSDDDSDDDGEMAADSEDDDDFSPDGEGGVGNKRPRRGGASGRKGGAAKKKNKIALDRFLDYGEVAFHIRIPPIPSTKDNNEGEKEEEQEGEKNAEGGEEQEEELGEEAEVVVQTYRLVSGKLIDNRMVVWGRRQEHVEALLKAAWRAEGKSMLEEEQNDKKKGVNFYQPIVTPLGVGWVRKSTLAPRDGTTLILNGDTLDRVIADAKEFLKPETKQFYAKCGIPYKRHYLLHGLPGTGKSSLVHVVAAATGMDVYDIKIGTLSGDAFTELMENRSRKRIVLMEDIDGVYSKDGQRQDVNFPLPVLLNALDSCSAEGGLLVFMTTNFRSELTPRLVRPGRVDVEIEFYRSSADQARKLVNLYAPAAKPEVADAVAETAEQHVITPAMIQRAVFRRGTTFGTTASERAAAQCGDAVLNPRSVAKELALMAGEDARNRGDNTGMYQ